MMPSKKPSQFACDERALMQTRHLDLLQAIQHIEEEINRLKDFDTSLTEIEMDARVELLSNLERQRSDLIDEAEQLEQIIASSRRAESAQAHPRLFSKRSNVPPNTPNNIEMELPEALLNISNSPADSSDEDYGDIIPGDPFTSSFNG